MGFSCSVVNGAVTDIPFSKGIVILLAAPRDLDDKFDVSRKVPVPNYKMCKSAITDTPEKENILSRRRKRPAKCRRKTASSRCDSDISMHLASDNESGDESSISVISEIPGGRMPPGYHLEINDFAVIKAFSAEGKHKNFVGKICDESGKTVKMRSTL